MRVLLLLRGSPGCGKSTWIENNGLSQYALSADKIRLMYQSPRFGIDGREMIGQDKDKQVWKTLFNILEERMEDGSFTIIDATNTTTSSIDKYKKLAKKYRYRIYLKDFSNVPIEVSKERNANRKPEYKRVPDYVIDGAYEKLKINNIPSGITLINEVEELEYKPTDLSDYEAINLIGDIHGCYDTLKKFIDEKYNENELYVFLGDYLDRGIQNADTLNLMMELSRKDNVLVLEGNHEDHLRKYSNNEAARSKTFRCETAIELDKAISDGMFTKDNIKSFCNRLGQCCFFKYGNDTYLATHGGICNLHKNIIYFATSQMIHGVGTYDDYLTMTGFDTSEVIQINGHRNVEKLDIHVSDKRYNLEGDIEHGGELRTLRLCKNKHGTLIEKNTFRLDQLDLIKNNPEINEKNFGDISSFNFSRNAFKHNLWDKETINARGLFINTKTRKVVARGYEKFFNIGERPETKEDVLVQTMKFPCDIYVKENGFLGILSWDSEKDDFLICSKSVIYDGTRKEEPVGIFRDMLYRLTDENQLKLLKDITKDNKTVLFEVINNELDPHIIKYDNERLVVLDIVDNDYEFKKMPYYELLSTFNGYEDKGFMVKEYAYVISRNDAESFKRFLKEIKNEKYKYDGRNIEGFVIEDSNGFMVKAKLGYYNKWKKLRSISGVVLKNGEIKNASSLNKESLRFYMWLKEYWNHVFTTEGDGGIENMPHDIIGLREKFIAERGNDYE